MNLTEAFHKLDLLESEDFNLSSTEDSADLKNFIDDDELQSDVEVIDMEANEEDDIEDSYVGKVVIDCCVCHSKFYKDPSEITIDEETGNCNVDEECPVCFSQDGYKVLGKIVPYNGDDEITDADEEEDFDDDEIEDLPESYRAYRRRRMTEKKHLCAESEELDETVKGTLLGAGAGAVGALLRGKSPISGAIRGGFAGSGASNIMAGKGTALDYAKIGGAYGGLKGAVAGGIAGKVAGGAVNKGLANLKGMLSGANGKENASAISALLKQNNVSDDAIQNILSQIMNESLNEDLQSFAVETDDELISLQSTENGGFSVTSEPKTADGGFEDMGDMEGMGEIGDETLAPLDAEDEREITGSDTDDGLDMDSAEQEMAMEDESEGEPEDEESVDVDVDEVQEESFNRLGEAYLKRVYDNVSAFRATNAKQSKNKLIIEGVIKFNSGKTKKTSFIFESATITKRGKVKFIGENKEITRGKKAFTATGKVRRGNLIFESLNYNYRQKDAKGASKRVYGTVR